MKKDADTTHRISADDYERSADDEMAESTPESLDMRVY